MSQNSETAAMLVSQTNPVRVENAFLVPINLDSGHVSENALLPIINRCKFHFYEACY